jgi:hypothetical protein
MDGLKGVAMGVKYLVDGLHEVLHQVKAVRNLDRVGGAWPASVRIGSGPLPGDHTDAGMGLSPQGHGFGRPIGPEGERSTPLEINHDGPIGPTIPNGPVVDSEHLRGGHVREGQTTPQSQESMATDAQAQATAPARPGRSRSRHSDVHQPRREPLRPPRPGGDQRGQPLGQEATGAAAIGAEELPHLQVQHDAPWSPRQLHDLADIAAMNPPRRKPANRTMDQGLCRGHSHRELGGGVVRVPGIEV